jgi:hypothetical protein
MKARILTSSILLISLIAAAWVTPALSGPVDAPAPAVPTAGPDLLFIENAGQFPPEVQFYVYGTQPAVWIGRDGLHVASPPAAPSTRGEREAGKRAGIYAPYDALPTLHSRTAAQRRHPAWLHVALPGQGGHLEPVQRLDTRVNFYPSADTATWHTGVPVWRGVRYRDIVPGTDLEITGAGGRLAWRLSCRADCQSVPLEFEIELRRLERQMEERQLPRTVPALGQSGWQPLLPGPVNQLSAAAAPADNPGALQDGTFFGGSQPDGAAGLALGSDGTVYVAGTTASTGGMFTGPFFVAGFSPDLSAARFITFLGGVVEYDTLSDLAMDAAGYLYVTGTTHARTFPVTPGAFDTVLNDGRAETCATGWSHLPCSDAFAARLSDTGQLLYATYLGGAQKMIPGLGNNGGADEGAGIAADAAGNIYVAGTTDSDDFATTPGAFDRTFSYFDIGLNPDVFVAKLSPQGQGAADLRYATYVGSGFVNGAQAMALDANGVVHVTGYVDGNSSLLDPKIGFPTTPGAYPTTSQCVAYTCEDVFYFQLNPAGNGSADLLYGTLFGGTADTFWETEYGADVQLLADGTVALVGTTETPDFPTTPGAFMAKPPGDSFNAFVARFNPAGQGVADLVYSTYLGGQYNTYGHSVAVDAGGDLYVSGATHAPNFPFTRGAYDTSLNGASDVYVVRLRPQGGGADDLVYGTYLGGSGGDDGLALALEGAGTLLVAGRTASYDFPMPDGGYDTDHNGNTDAFAVRLAVGQGEVSGRVTDSAGDPVGGVLVRAGSDHYATTGSDGSYTLADLPAGTFSVTVEGGYFWTPQTRTVSVPPDVTDQDFVGHNARKAVTPASFSGTLFPGTPLTYTIDLVFPDDTPRSFYDAVPTYTTYLPGSLHAPAGVIYEPAVGANGKGAITGPLSFTPGEPFSVTFGVASDVTGSAGFAPQITNRACVYPTGAGLDTCVWSNAVRTFSFARTVYLPLLVR